MIETGCGMWNAKTVYAKMSISMIDIARSWVKEKAKSVREFPVLSNGQRGLQIGWGFGFSHVGRRMILQPDGTLIWLTADYAYENAAEEREYASKLTLEQVEKAITQLKHIPSAVDKGGRRK